MDLSERIRDLRKQKGLSQEQLAEMLDVSRQAVSKWEGGQSSPDLDKITTISELFGVSTDYLLKGLDTDMQANQAEADASSKRSYGAARILEISASALIAAGLVYAIFGWYEEQTASSIGGGIIIQLAGITAFICGKILTHMEEPSMALSVANIWLLIFIPASVTANLAFGYPLSPYPYFNFGLIALFIFLYIAACTACTCALFRYLKKTKAEKNK